MDRVVIQGQYFETPSINVAGVKVYKLGDPNARGWLDEQTFEFYQKRIADSGMSEVVDESVLGPALMKMRIVFSDNERSSMERHLKSGRVNQRVLGKRAWSGDERLFQKKRMPGRKSYSVLIGIDISGSTTGLNLHLAKRAAWAQAELCHRMGIEFAVFAHTATRHRSQIGLDIYTVKDFDQPWTDVTRNALHRLASASENLDGHTIEYYRKAIEPRRATDKIILYYTDGKMPAANHDEELEILQREIVTCRKKKVSLLGVGIRTDSPTRHGLPTVQVDSDDDMIKVVTHLESALLRNR